MSMQVIPAYNNICCLVHRAETQAELRKTSHMMPFRLSAVRAIYHIKKPPDTGPLQRGYQAAFTEQSCLF